MPRRFIGGGGIAPRILDVGTWRMCGQLHAPAALPLSKEPPVTIGKEAGWAIASELYTWIHEEIRKLHFHNRCRILLIQTHLQSEKHITNPCFTPFLDQNSRFKE